MSSRERWTVYPLLFLSLGISVRTGLAQRVAQEEQVREQITCKILTLENAAGRRVQLGCAAAAEPELQVGGSVVASGFAIGNTKFGFPVAAPASP